MQLVSIQTDQDWKLFHKVPHRIYANDPKWVCPLESDVRDIFRPEKNKTLQNGEYELYVLLDEQNKPAGRIAIFIDHARNQELPYPVAGLGFFECINDSAYAKALLAQAEKTAKKWGVKALDGPINFGERDKFWGLHVKGDIMPLYQENYHPVYYQQFFNDFGFEPYEQVLTFGGAPADFQADRLKAIAARSNKRYNFRAAFLDPNQLERFADDFRIVYNAAFAEFEHYKPLDTPQVLEIFQAAKPILDPNLVVVAYLDEEPVGFCALLPDINPALQHAKGRLNFWTLPRFLWKFRFAKTRVAKGVAFGIHPDHQRKGVFAVMVDHMYVPANLERYAKIALATIRGHNEMMVKSIRALGVSVERVHHHCRKPLDDSITVEPFPFLEVD